MGITRLLLWITLLSALPLNCRAQLREEFLGPLAGWANVKTEFGTVGDGRADDTAALQRALDAMLDEKSPRHTLYLPAGRYRITRTLILPRQRGNASAIGLSIQGEHPDRTALVWDGASDGVMVLYGAWYAKLGRITLDGAARASIALKHGPEFVTANEISDMVFRDVGVGIEAGEMRTAGIAETSVRRCRFIRCAKAGVSIQNFNTLDWWLWDCIFEECGTGVTNAFGAGNFLVYDSLFRRSRVADLSIGNTGYFSFRGNTSVGSKAFFVAANIGAGALITLQGNRVVDPVDAQAVRVGNLGPVILLDNTFISRPEVKSGPVATGENARCLSMSNTFTVSDPLRFQAPSIALDDRSVSHAAARREIPAVPVTPERFTGPVVEVSAGADTAAIQRAIDSCAKFQGKRPVVHLPAGRFDVTRTLTIPAGSDLRLVGEGIPYRTLLAWAGEGAGPMIRIAGPGRAEVRDLALECGKKADAIAIEGSNRPGARVRFEQSQVAGAGEAGYLVEGVEKGSVLLRDCGHSGSKIGVKVIGPGSTVVLSGASSSNDLSYDVSHGGRLLVRDIWYETNEQPRFLRLTDSGEFTLHNGIAAHPRKPGEPGVEIAGFAGKISLLGVTFTQVSGPEGLPDVVVRGGPQARVLALGSHGTGEWFRRESGDAARIMGLRYTAGGGAERIPDVGSATPALLREMLRQTREVTGFPRRTPGSEVVVYRVFVRDARVAYRVK